MASAVATGRVQDAARARRGQGDQPAMCRPQIGTPGLRMAARSRLSHECVGVKVGGEVPAAAQERQCC